MRKSGENIEEKSENRLEYTTSETIRKKRPKIDEGKAENWRKKSEQDQKKHTQKSEIVRKTRRRVRILPNAQK